MNNLESTPLWANPLEQKVNEIEKNHNGKSLPLHHIVRDFKVLVAEHRGDENFTKLKPLSDRIAHLSKEKVDYYQISTFGFITEFFSKLRNRFAIGVFRSSGELGLDLSNAFNKVYEEKTSKQNKEPEIGQPDSKTQEDNLPKEETEVVSRQVEREPKHIEVEDMIDSEDASDTASVYSVDEDDEAMEELIKDNALAEGFEEPELMSDTESSFGEDEIDEWDSEEEIELPAEEEWVHVSIEPEMEQEEVLAESKNKETKPSKESTPQVIIMTKIADMVTQNIVNPDNTAISSLFKEIPRINAKIEEKKPLEPKEAMLNTFMTVWKHADAGTVAWFIVLWSTLLKDANIVSWTQKGNGYLLELETEKNGKIQNLREKLDFLPNFPGKATVIKILMKAQGSIVVSKKIEIQFVEEQDPNNSEQYLQSIVFPNEAQDIYYKLPIRWFSKVMRIERITTGLLETSDENLGKYYCSAKVNTSNALGLMTIPEPETNVVTVAKNLNEITWT